MTSRKLLLVGIDGLRIDDALADGSAPSLASLIAHGRLHPVEMEVPTISGPGWSSILTGTRHEVHGVFDNTFSGNRLDRTVDLLTRAARADPARSTFAASSWPPLAGSARARTGRRDEARRPARRAAPPGRPRRRDVRLPRGRRRRRRVRQARHPGRRPRRELRLPRRGRRGRAPVRRPVARVHAARPSGSTGCLGGILHEVERRAQDHAEDWLVGVTTDHGHLDEGGHGGDDAVLTRSFLALRRYGPEPLAPAAAEAVRPEEIRPEEIARAPAGPPRLTPRPATPRSSAGAGPGARSPRRRSRRARPGRRAPGSAPRGGRAAPPRARPRS